MLYSRYSIHDLVKLEKRRFREEEGVFLIEGKKILAEAQTANLELVQVLVTEKFLQQQTDFVREQHLQQYPLMHVSESNLARLAGTVTPQGIMAVVKKPATTLAQLVNTDFVVVCDNIRDPGNLGTIMRTADWFGVKGMLISRDGVDPYHDKVVRATMGSLFHLQIVVSENLVADCEKLKEAGFLIVVSRPEANSTLPAATNKQNKICLVLGNESVGTSVGIDEIASATMTIPRYGEAESLNVAVSFGIMMSELRKETSS